MMRRCYYDDMIWFLFCSHIYFLFSITQFDEKYIDINSAKSIFGTSSGSIIGATLCLKYDWSDIVDYVTNKNFKDNSRVFLNLKSNAYSDFFVKKFIDRNIKFDFLPFLWHNPDVMSTSTKLFIFIIENEFDFL